MSDSLQLNRLYSLPGKSNGQRCLAGYIVYSVAKSQTWPRHWTTTIFLKGNKYSHWLWATIFSSCFYMLQKDSFIEVSNEQLMPSTILIFWRSTNQEGIIIHISKLCWKPLLIYLKYLLIKMKYCSYHRSYLLWGKEQRSLFKFVYQKMF